MKDGQDANAVFCLLIDDPVILEDQFTDCIVISFRDSASRLRMFRRTLRSTNQTRDKMVGVEF